MTTLFPRTGRMLTASAAIVVFLMSGLAATANLLVNGGFETGDLTGWSVSETGSNGQGKDYGVTHGKDSGYGPVPHSGYYGAYLNPTGGTIDLFQSIDIPVAGDYAIDFWVQPFFNDDDIVTVFLNGVQVSTTDFTVGGPYTEINVMALASAGVQTLDFQFKPGSGPIFFDDACINAAVATVPEATTLWAGLLLLLFAAGACLSNWKSRSA